MNINKSELIIAEALRLGFDACAIAPASQMKDECSHMEQWLASGMHGMMRFLEKSVEKRFHPNKVLPNVKSVLVTLTNYYPVQKQREDKLLIAKYAYGKDYHVIIKKKLLSLSNFIHHLYGEINERIFIDSSALFEKAWAQRAGLGSMGKIHY